MRAHIHKQRAWELRLQHRAKANLCTQVITRADIEAFLLGHLGSGDLSYSRAVNAWTTGLGKWRHCCSAVNKVRCYLTRPSNSSGSNAFSSSPSFCSREDGSMEQSCWLCVQRPRSSIYERRERSYPHLNLVNEDKVTDKTAILS